MPIIPLDKIYAAANAKSLSRGGRGLAEEEEEDQVFQEEEEEVSGLADFALSIPRGVAGAAEEILEIPQIFGATYEIPDNFGLGTSKTGLGSMAEGVTSFAAGFIPVLGWMGKAGKAGKVVKGGKAAAKAAKASKTAKWGKYVAAGAIADFAVFDGQEARLANLIQMYPALENPVSEYLASNIEDSELEGRLKNVVEGAAIGGVIDVLAASLRLVRKSRDLRAKGASPEEVLKGTAREQEELIKANKKVQQDKQQKKAKKEQQQKPQQEGQDPLIPEKPEAPEPEPAPKNPRYTAILKEFTKKPKKGQKSASQEMLDDITNNPPEEALAKILARFQKDGVLININSFTDGDTVSREAVALVEGLGDAILKTKKDFLLDDAHRTEIIRELDEFGFPESSDLFQGLADQHAKDAKFLSASISMRNHTKQMTENLVNRTLLQEQLAKATTHSEELAIGIELNKAELRFLQHREQGSVLAAALGAVRSKRGKDLVNLRWMDEAALKQDEKKVAEHLDTLLANRKLTPEQHAKAMDAAAAVAKKHGDAAVAKLGPGKGMIDMHNELWINALLSGPRTSAINTIGNAITGIYLPLEKGLGAHIAWKRTKDARYLAARKELWNLTFFLEGLRESLSFGVAAFRKEDSIIQSRAAVTAELEGASITGKAFQEQRGPLGWIGKNFEHGVNKTGEIIRTPTKLLTGTDEFFKQMQFRYTVKVHSAMKAHDQLLKKYGEETIPTDELATLTSDIMEGVIRENGERYSAAAVRRDGWAALQQAMKDEPDGFASSLTQREFMRDYYLKNFDETKGGVSDAAFKDAQEATFTSLQEGKLGKGIQELVGKIPALRLIMPFVSTPLNILRFFGQRSLPANAPITRSIHDRYMKDIALDSAGKPKDPMAFAAAKGRFAAGTALWSTAVLMAQQGRITGHGPEKESERAVLKETGWLPYAFEIGGTYISYERLDPFATFFGMAADITEYATDIDREDDTLSELVVPAVITGLSQNVFNKSYMTGIEQFMSAASQPQRKLDSYLRTRVSSYIPAVLGQAAGSLDGDEAIREARTIFESLKKRIPGAGDLDPRRNVLGEIVKQPNRLGPDYISPIVMSSRKKDAVIDEMAKAQHAFTTPSSKIQGGIDLIEVRNNKNQTAYDRWLELQSQMKIGGKTLRQQLSNLVKDKRFRNLSDIPEADFSSPRAKAIKRIISKYRALAKRKMLSEFPDLMKESALVDQINFNRARGRDVEGLLQQLKGLR